MKLFTKNLRHFLLNVKQFLSMKLAALNPTLEFINVDHQFAKQVTQFILFPQKGRKHVFFNFFSIWFMFFKDSQILDYGNI